MIRYWYLSKEDIRFINLRRRDHNRLGFAAQLCLLRYPGWPLGPNEIPPTNLVEFTAAQLGADPDEIRAYPTWDETRREHLSVISRAYGFRPFSTLPTQTMLRQHLLSEALLTDAAYSLVQTATNWLREHRIILPTLSRLESLVRSVRSEVERQIYGRLAGRLSREHRIELERMLETGPSRGSLFGWIRRVPRSCSPAGVCDLIQRISWIRDRGVSKDVTEEIPAVRIQQLAARGGRHSLSHFRRFPPEKRHAILAAFLLHVAGELTDRAVDFHNRLIGRMFHQAEDRRWIDFSTDGASVNAKLHNYARLTEAIIKAKKQNRGIEGAIEAVMDWEMLEKDGQAAGRLSKPLRTTGYESFRAHYSQFRQYTPKFLAILRFNAIPELTPLMNAIDTLRKMNEEGASSVPADAPRSFVTQRWAPFVFDAEGIDRCYYEFCILSELSLGLRSGDIWIEGSRRYQKFDSYLIAPTVWAAQKAKSIRDAELPLDCDSYLSQRRQLIDDQLRIVADLTRRQLLPEARMEGTRLVISPLTRSGPDKAEEWANRVYDLVPRVHLTQVLEEVNGWTRFTKAFTHLYTGQPAGDRTGLLTTILAAATNLGKTKMAHATESYTADRLAWIEDWYISERNYARPRRDCAVAGTDSISITLGDRPNIVLRRTSIPDRIQKAGYCSGQCQIRP
jgi:TnpA family transposase